MHLKGPISFKRYTGVPEVRVGVLHQIYDRVVQHVMKKVTQSDLGFCKNEELKKSKNYEKGG